ncbi:unnamed protein product [Mesocestoides corti]|uniref:BPTI/Kunitz inhibitor domain-containing protein n=2 Tax=Mesocestoides corti TaxID=53468 RepID=A0A0R3U7J1_MESCO|nr:unnamed protein product [Mesocestoides corti]
MAGNNYEAVGKSSGRARGGSKAGCCMKFWLVVFILTTLALTAAVLWLVLAPEGGIKPDKTKSVGEEGVMSGASVRRLPGICTLPPARGPCKASIERFFYDTTSATCQKFIYGGCSGNANNFETLNQCLDACSPSAGQSVSKDDSIPESGDDVVDTTVCQLPLEQGNCLAYFQRWGFDASQGRCVQFIYGGCGGNANNFETKEACEQRCIANIPMPIPAANDETLDPVCKLPKEVGPCRAAYRRWTYDLSKGQCVEFTYGGCLGNANNFETKEACEAKCGGKMLLTEYSQRVYQCMSFRHFVALALPY